MAGRTGWTPASKLAARVFGLAALTALAFLLLFPSNEELARRLAAQAEAGLGVPVTIGEVRWQLFPPAISIEQAATVQPEPIRFRRLVAQPVLGALLRRRE